jgi:hypothetical protein
LLASAPIFSNIEQKKQLKVKAGSMKRISLLVIAGVLAAFIPVSGDLCAEPPSPFPDFKPKFVKPPKAGERKRVNVQINRPKPAVAPATPAAVAPSGAVARTSKGQYD